MKRHISVQELVNELQLQNLKKKDLVIPSSCLSMKNGNLVVSNPSKNPELDKILYETGISSVDDSQTINLQCLDTIDNNLADKLDIPRRYFEKMRKGHTSILDENVKYWFGNNSGNYLLRTFIDKDEQSGVARALLSDRFRTIDNYDILIATLQAINESGLNIKLDTGGADISDRRLYLRFVCPDIEIQAPELLKRYRPNGKDNEAGNGIISGFVLSNSEVGCGALTISARAKILACSNGLVKTDEKFNQRHLGAKLEEFSSVDWSAETKNKNLELIIHQIKDTIKTFVSEEFLGRHIQETIEKGSKELQHPLECVKQVTTSLGMSEQKANDVLNIFLKSGDTSAFGVAQAITLYAHTQGDADEQFELEKSAAEVLNSIDEFDKPMVKKSTKTQEKLN